VRSALIALAYEKVPVENLRPGFCLASRIELHRPCVYRSDFDPFNWKRHRCASSGDPANRIVLSLAVEIKIICALEQH